MLDGFCHPGFFAAIIDILTLANQNSFDIIGDMVLTTTAAVMDELGGTEAVARLTGRNYKAAFAWRAFTAFPANTFLVLNAALKERGHTAPLSLWRMASAERPISAAAP